MDYYNYLNQIGKKMVLEPSVNIGEENCTFACKELHHRDFGENMKMQVHCFFKHVNGVDARMVEDYSEKCYDYSKKNCRGIARGLGEGFVSVAVMVGGNVDEAAINAVEKWKRKHFSAMEIPVIVDLKTGKVHVFKKCSIWGFSVQRVVREYINDCLRFQV